LTISGAAPDQLETRWRHEAQPVDGPPPRENAASRRAPKPSSKLDGAVARVEARTALVGMGWKPAIARTALDAAASHVGPDAPLEVWVREALRHCPLPRTS
jgi:Holliday junction resolvase RuvA-like protein